MKVMKVNSAVNLQKYARMSRIKYVVWAFVPRDVGNGPELLTVRRNEVTDVVNNGKLVIPGGGQEYLETPEQAAIREVWEETGVDCYQAYKVNFFRNREVYFNVSEISGVLLSGSIVMHDWQKDKLYWGRLIRLTPIYPNNNPVENPQSDAIEPRYMSFKETESRKGDFSPASKIMLEIIFKNLYRMSPPS